MADTYNVFISWSGERSQKVGAALYDWLPMVVQSAKPWMSAEDIEKGSRGLDEIAKALDVMSVGVICLTPENLERPWILFETGALSKALGDKTRVCPYLFGDLPPEDVKPPIGMFQATRAVKDDTRKLVGTVNRVLGGSLTEEKLDTLFARMWPELEKNLAAIPAAGRAAAPPRTDREIIAEVLGLVRAGTVNSAQAAEELAVLTAGVREVLDRVTGPRLPLSAFSGIGTPTTFGGIASGGNFGGGFGRLADSPVLGVTAQTPEDKANRARLIAEITKQMEQEGKKREAKKPNDESK